MKHAQHVENRLAIEGGIDRLLHISIALIGGYEPATSSATGLCCNQHSDFPLGNLEFQERPACAGFVVSVIAKLACLSVHTRPSCDAFRKLLSRAHR